MDGVREQGQRVRGDPGDGLHHGENEDERERKRQRATVAVEPLVRCVSVHARTVAAHAARDGPCPGGV